MNSVVDLLKSAGCDYEIRVFKQPAHKARQAANLLGCPLGAVVKSLVFETDHQTDFLLVLVSGQNRVDTQKLSKILGWKVRPAEITKVLELTGYPVGAVPPFGIKNTCKVIIDADLMVHERLWGAAGDTNILVSFSPVILKELTGGLVCDISQ
jgi:Cys-tRNA(Pro) deacylase